MRDIKFRVWSVDGKVFRKSYSTEFMDITDNIAEYMDADGFVLMQYTGLKDKNGKEIYEGDVLHPTDDSCRVVIEFVGGQFVGINTDKNHPIRETQNRNWLQWVVIGNIYENPELLKEVENA